MRMLNNLTISQRLLIPSAIVLGGFIAIVLVYQQGERLRLQAEQHKRQVTTFYNDAVLLKSLVLRAENTMKDFLLRNDSADVDRHAETLRAITLRVDRLSRQAPDEAMDAEVQNFRDNLKRYQAITRQLVDSKIKLGLNEEQGLLGSLRQAIHDVEHVLARHDEIRLAHSMLMMRRHEKDFLARLKDKYVIQMGEEHQRFSALLRKSSLSDADKANIQDKVDYYYKSFLSLVKGRQQVESDVAEARNVVAGLESALDTLTDNAQSVLLITEQQLARDVGQISQAFYLSLSLIGLVVIGLLFLLSRNISGALALLIERMRELAEGRGDLSRRLHIAGKDETAELAGLVNRLMESLSALIGKVQQSGIRVASSVTEIAASAREQEATATEHAATTNQVAASVKEITATSRQLGQTTEEVAGLAQGTAASATDGQQMLASLDATMNRMASVSGSITDKLAVLNEKASKIGDMVTTINKVADQTNLLSLNAAIEAEKAGEYGRGFAVVATEIRRLADQTAVATYDIEQMVAEVQSAVSAGVMSMDKFSEEIQSSVREARQAGAQLEKVIEQVQALAPHIEAVNEGLQAQITGASQIDEAMMSLSEAAQQTAEFARQSNSAIAELNEAARALQEGAAIFKVRAS